jgi:hypothetical protein
MPTQSSFARIGVVAIVAASLALLAYLVLEALSDPGSKPPASTPEVVRPEPDKQPLPQDATTVAGLWDMAWAAARAWNRDARLTRMYAASVHPDGTFDRARADVQFVFLSRELTERGGSQGAVNGLRWMLSQGKTHSMELKQYPAPSLDLPEARLCDLKELAGVDPPAEVVVDVTYVEQDGKAPVLSMFTEDRRFMVLADPSSCQVRGRATGSTAQELDGGRGGGGVDAGRAFDTAAASRQVQGVLAGAGACKRAGGPEGAGTVSVRFDGAGKVDEVTFQMGGYAGTEVGRCIEERLRGVRVGPWDSGRGFIIKRFSL